MLFNALGSVAEIAICLQYHCQQGIAWVCFFFFFDLKLAGVCLFN